MIGWLMRLLCPHKWRCVGVWHYIDTSWNSHALSTCATFRCARCGAIKAKSMYGVGHLSKEQLNGVDRAAMSREQSRGGERGN